MFIFIIPTTFWGSVYICMFEWARWERLRRIAQRGCHLRLLAGPVGVTFTWCAPMPIPMTRLWLRRSSSKPSKHHQQQQHHTSTTKRIARRDSGTAPVPQTASALSSESAEMYKRGRCLCKLHSSYNAVYIPTNECIYIYIYSIFRNNISFIKNCIHNLTPLYRIAPSLPVMTKHAAPHYTHTHTHRYRFLCNSSQYMRHTVSYSYSHTQTHIQHTSVYVCLHAERFSFLTGMRGW